MQNQVLDFIIRIKNAALVLRSEVAIPYSKINHEIGKVLLKEGFLDSLKKDEGAKRKMLVARLRYENRKPVLTNVEIVSRPSLRVYVGAKDSEKFERRGKTTAIISTNQGILTGKEARKKIIGGELLFKIW